MSLIIGTVVGLTQFRIKRLFAYSSISHVGFMLLSLSICSVESLQAFLFYLTQYTISNLNAFFILIVIGFSLYFNNNSNKEHEELKDKINSPVQLVNQLKGYFYINPFMSLSLSITIFSFAGIPPLLGFFGKQMVLSAALDKGYIFLSLVAIITSVIGAVYVRPLINIMPGSLNPLSETPRDKPINLSDFEMNRGVKHVVKGSKILNYIGFRAKVILSHAKFNLRVNHAPVKSKIVDTILQNISLKNILGYIVSFCRPETKCLTEFAKRKISDIILGTGDLLREVIPKISLKLISSILFLAFNIHDQGKDGYVEGRRSFRSINGSVIRSRTFECEATALS
jgi:hypothetical protein